MSDIIDTRKELLLNIQNPEDIPLLGKVSHALANPCRIRILQSLTEKPKYLSDLSQELDIPASSLSRHIDALAEARLIRVSYRPGPKGHMKCCSQALAGYGVRLAGRPEAEAENKEYSVEMPIGMFTRCSISAPCGMTGREGNIGVFDNPAAFFLPERSAAECLWFHTGFIDYSFPAYPLFHHRCREIAFSFEVCSETFYYNNVWPSDITVCVNGRELVTFTSPGDFGGRRGRYTPEYWPINSTQFGMLKKIAVNGDGVFVDNVLAGKEITFDDLDLYGSDFVELRIGIKNAAAHKGGINLFGKNFGDYPQAIVMTVK